jgi:methylated-DNA-protein-cysteine methyltransferase-like protein
MKTNFFEDVYDVVKLIPEGRWTSYGAIAHYLGAKGSARMVGWAMNNSHGLPDVPAHRVLNRNGELTGKAHFIPPESMEQKLIQEGLKVINNQVENPDKSFWDPSKELI